MKKPSKTTPKSKPLKSVKKDADKWFSVYIRRRDEEEGCITCGVKKPWGQMQAGHFVKRSVNTLRYDEENVNAQCYVCNVMRYGEQFLYAKALDVKYGDGTAEKLMSQRWTTHKFTIQELQEIIHDAKQAILWYDNPVAKEATNK